MAARKRLLVLGGGRFNVACIRAARDANFETLVADRNSQAPGLQVADIPIAIDPSNVEALLLRVKELGGIDGVVSMAEVGVRPAAQLSARLQLPGISEGAAALATSKAAMRHRWSVLREHSAAFEVVSTLDEALAAVKKLGVFPLIFKPDRSFGGSRGVRRVDREDQVPQSFTFALEGGLTGSEVVIEEFLVGSEHSAEVLIWDGAVSVLCIGQKVKSRFPYRVDVSVQYPSPALSPEHQVVIAVICREAARALDLSQGAAHIEFVQTARGPVLMELGARCGGGHTPQIAAHVSGVDEFVECCRMACGLAPSQLVPNAARGADYRFLIFPPLGRIARVQIPAHVTNHEQVLDVAVTAEPGDQIGPLRTTADRTGVLVTAAQNRETAVAVADWACTEIAIIYDDGQAAHAYPLSHFHGGQSQHDASQGKGMMPEGSS